MEKKPSLHLKLVTKEERLGLATVANIATLTRNIEAITSNFFRNAAVEAKGINETLCERVTLLVMERSCIKANLRYTRSEKRILQTSLRAYEDELPELKDQLQDAEEAYESSRTALRRAETEFQQRKIEQTAVRVAGAAFFAIPFVGWVSLIASETALQKNVDSAKENLKDAENHFQDKRNLIEEKAKAIEEQTSKIKTVNQDIDRLQKNEDEIEEKLRKCQENYKKCQENYEKQTVICNQLQECQHFISTIAGRSENLRDQMTFFYDIQLLLGPLKSLAVHLTPELSADFLECSAFQDFHQNLKAIASQESSDARMHAMALSLNAIVTITNKEIIQHLNCEHFLVPAPMALAIFGQVCTLLLKRNFSIEVPREGFKFLKWPNSFRANLQEISHAISSAFETADKIHASAEVLPILLSHTFEILEF